MKYFPSYHSRLPVSLSLCLLLLPGICFLQNNPAPKAPASGPAQISGVVLTPQGKALAGARIHLRGTGAPEQNFVTAANGAFAVHGLEKGAYQLEPAYHSDPRPGINALDLALLSKHILGVKALETPYQFIAADVNRSACLTTSDIATLRKLLLGKIDTLPVGSWVFVDKNYVFPDSSNPLIPMFPQSTTIPNVNTNSNNLADFVAIKVGDVNNNASTMRPAERPLSSLAWNIPAAEVGQVLSIPVYYQGDTPLEALQLGLRFDPSTLGLLTFSPGDLPSWHANCFNLSRAGQGEIKAAWVFSDPDQMVQPGQILFYLHFKVKAPLGSTQNLLRFDDTLLPGAAWRSDNTEYALAYRETSERSEIPATTPDAAFAAACLPNPGAGAPQFRIQAGAPRRARLHLFDAAGAPLHVVEWQLQGGEQTLSLPEAAKLPAGVYIWKILSAGEKAQGFWVKL